MNRKIKTLIGATSAVAMILSGCAGNSTPDVSTDIEKESTVVTETAEKSVVESTETDSNQAEGVDSSIYVVYTNDVHTYINNVIKDSESEEEVPGLRFSKISQMVKDMRAEGKEVILVDAGDQIQGTSYGSIDEGISVVKIMNETGYQLSAIGNHEFDYGMFQFYNVVDNADYEYISCNFHCTDPDSTQQPFEASKIYEIGGKKVAFIGITTPEAITSSTPTYFQNEKGEYIYEIDGVADANDLYTSVQNAIDEVRDEVDYCIGLGHVGVGISEKKAGISSEDVIAHTKGLDAFIDGHSHSTIEGDKIKDAEGKDVILSQTGSYLNHVGLMEISAEGITTSFVDDYDSVDANIEKMENDLVAKVNEMFGVKVASLDTELYVNNPDNENQRLIRSTELNNGDFMADSTYWYFNEKKGMDCDIAFVNGGGIRTFIKKGDVLLQDIKNVMPFGNMICMINATGQQIVDALEMGVNVIGVWDDEWDSPAENGGFMHVAGLKYTIDSTIESSLNVDESGMFKSVDGEYRVKDVEVYNKESKKYEPIDLDKEYTVSGTNYILRNNGNGLSMFENCDMVVDYVGQDWEIAVAYIKSFALDGEYPRINTKNSPLSAYENYLIDYENPYGAGRIQIITE